MKVLLQLLNKGIMEQQLLLIVAGEGSLLLLHLRSMSWTRWYQLQSPILEADP